jgi:diguanylate cyclase (GGDEF)-like protein/PAS domain S-box-containing protein
MQDDGIYRSLFEQSIQGMIVLRGEQIIFANQSFADTIGYAFDEVLTFSIADLFNLFHPQDREAAIKKFHASFAGKEPQQCYESRFIRKNGETGWWSITISTVADGDQPIVQGIFIDVTDRKKKEANLEAGRNLMAATLDVLPVGVCLTDEDGYYRMMNDAYCAIYEYDREEMLGKHYSVIMPPDQFALANAHYVQVLGGDVGIPVERKRQRKDGSIAYIEAANALVQAANGQKMVITTIRDVTERMQAVEIIRLRLGLMEYAATHTLNKLMQKALDAIGELTGSPIGFYHFVDEDQNMLSLQAWSTRTLAEFCEMRGEGLHYPVEEAGVWADCVRQRKPIIHNDYPGLPHRKGLPEGHAKVMRELVIPTIRDGRVVAILGVGNKAKDYGEQDLEMVSYIADVVWSIIEQKKTSEQIQQLNAKLERLAMQDDLTGLLNRRAFFIQGEKEISRVERQHTPFSLLMLDVDVFKSVNDRYGHAAGDRVLKHVSQKIVENVREMDMVARMGGEEFSVLLPNTEAEDAVRLAERVRLAIERESCQLEEHIIDVTVSVGVASYSQEFSSLEAILRQADDSMYRAKNRGRNQVVFTSRP